MSKTCCASLSFSLEEKRADDTLQYERSLQEQGFATVAGVDEAGRGPLAGPVVAGCVVLTADTDHRLFQDSKKLSEKKRESLYDILQDSGTPYGVGIVSARTIDSINILQASLLAMKRAVEDCEQRFSCKPAFLLVDGKFTIPLSLPQQALVKGESRSASIAAASIIAKVTRDRLMARYHEEYPQYDLDRHKGYPTKAHRRAIAVHGPSPIHRRTFKGVREFCAEYVPPANKQQSRLW
jgi:ribonuclease HII